MNSTREAKNLVDLINFFIFSMHGRSLNTISTYKRILIDFTKYMPASPQDASVVYIESYLIKKQSSVKISTLNLYTNAIKSFYNWLEENYGYPNLGKFLTINPALPPSQRILSAQEYEAICQSPSEQHEKDCIKFLCNTGLRATEFVTLSKENIAGEFLRIIGKGRKNRSIPLIRPPCRY